MSNFKNNITEEQVAAYLEGKGTLDDITFLNCMACDVDLLDTMDTICEMDDIEEINELSSFGESII